MVKIKYNLSTISIYLKYTKNKINLIADLHVMGRNVVLPLWGYDL
jgi:hypothetical protein